MSQRLFEELEGKISGLEPDDAFKIGRDRWVLAVAGIGLVASLVPTLLEPSEGGHWVSVLGIVVELCALGVLTYRQVRDAVPDFLDAKRKFASELDGHFAQYQHLQAWLRSIPHEQRGARLAYVESRLESMSQRYPIFFGPTDKLGVLPGLVGIFLQVQALKSVSFTTGLLGGAVLALYLMGLWMTRFRLQLQSYARLLKSVSDEQRTEGQSGPAP